MVVWKTGGQKRFSAINKPKKILCNERVIGCKQSS